MQKTQAVFIQLIQYEIENIVRYVIKRCPIRGGSLTKIVIFGTKHFVRYSSHIHCLACPLLRGFTVIKRDS